MRYRKKPIVIEAFRFQIDEYMPDWFANAISDCTVTIYRDGTCHINTLEGANVCKQGRLYHPWSK